jgi:hypothetical protein
VAKAKQSGRQPSHRLKVFDKTTGRSDRVGAGWQNADGTISVVINMNVVLSEATLADRTLTLFPVDQEVRDNDTGYRAPPGEAASPP